VKRGIAAAILILGSFAAPALARAAEISHFNGGIANIRDYFIPEPGFYGLIYNYYYTTDQLNDGDGDEVHTVTLNPGPGRGRNQFEPSRRLRWNSHCLRRGSRSCTKSSPLAHASFDDSACLPRRLLAR
jgi:hypothetical protein